MVDESEIRQSDWLLTRQSQLMLGAESADISRFLKIGMSLYSL